jgi:hypothetical protein
MISHEDAGVQMELIAVLVCREGQEIFLIDCLVLEGLLPLAAIEHTGVFDAGISGHAGKVANRAEYVMMLMYEV